MSETVYLGLGTNLGDRQANLEAACKALETRLQVLAKSSVYETPPWGYLDQPKFLNMALKAQTDLSPVELLKLLKELETSLGRRPGERYGPRVIDIDILFYGSLILRQAGLDVPHPRLAERAFVLVPLAEIAPDLRHPVSGLTVQEMLDQIDASDIKLQPPSSAAPNQGALALGGHTLDWGKRTYMMGVLNITADSFSGDGLAQPGEDFVTAALAQARAFAAAGADILDVGGESTRPGAAAMDAEQELAHVLPVIQRIAEELDVLISIDTYKAPVALAALEAGAHIINDVWGLRADPALAETAAGRGAPLILMHNRSSWAHAEIKERLGGRYVGMKYQNLLEDVRRELMESVEIALSAGVPPGHIILDPGIGFGKTVEQNLELIDRLGEIRSLGYPVLLGPSRKSFIGYTLDLPPDQRLEGTAAAVAVGIARGADIVRVHDVAPLMRVMRMTDAIVRRAAS